MKATLLVSTIGLTLIASAPHAATQDDGGAGQLAVLRAQFEELRTDLFRNLVAFDARYEVELQKLEDAAAAEGKLPLVLAVRAEKESFPQRGAAPEPSAFPRLARLQKIYNEQTTKLNAVLAPKLTALVAGYRKNLNEMQIRLTKEKKIDEAIRVQEELAWLGGEAEKPGGMPPTAPVVGARGASEEREAGGEMESALRMKLCWIPAGKFTMGSPQNEAGRMAEREAQVEVELTRGFWMGKFEVTQGEWEAVMGTNPAKFKDAGNRAPVEQVSWEDAMAFCAKLTEAERKKGKLSDGWVYTLPTEAQWEYACRAGETGPYSGGELEEFGWYESNSGGMTREVGQKRANAWGLHDVHGNVREWCADWHADKLSGGKDPTGADSSSNRVDRGGSWSSDVFNCRAARRYRAPHLLGRYDFLGFRVCLSFAQ